jgi:SAM-dependent MidA family methyltransferase
VSLEARLAAMIAAGGSISIARYMDLCLHDRDFGYYATRPRLGADGDFITAPHVSQMVGELLGLWACEVFRSLGRPRSVRLVELGPGDGVMMLDVLRSICAAAPEFARACELVLLETSAPLRQTQERSLRATGRAISWIETIEDLPAGAPVIILANEFLDCLPIRQAVRTPGGWLERRVGLNEAERLAFTLSPPQPIPEIDLPAAAPVGTIAEWSPDLEAFASALGRLLAGTPGAALFLDYGCAGPENSVDTLQALRGHGKEDPLANPGEADLTAHVRFGPFLAAARAAGAVTPPLLTQAVFLRALGVETRAALLAQARPDLAEVIGRQLHRLIAPEEMGELFQAACIHSPNLRPPAFAGAS